MTSTKLSSHGQNRKDLDKFTKYLVYKYVQIIVQSRLGEKVRTFSKSVSSGSDWFSLAIRDIPEVLSETKKVYASGALTGADGGAICVEISLTTAEGESLTLESWSLSSAAPSGVVPAPSGGPSAYTRMSLLLKSLLCATRVTPAYRLSRSQGADSYVVCYRVHAGPSQTSRLGAGRRDVRLGTAPAAVDGGQVALGVAFRTEMLISPQRPTPLAAHATDLWGVEFRHDHFFTDSSSDGGGGGGSPRNPPIGVIGRYGYRHSLDEIDHQDRDTRRVSMPTAVPACNGGRPSCRKRLSSEGFNGILREDEAWTARQDASPVSQTRSPRLGAFATLPAALPDGDDDMPFSCLLQDSEPSPAASTTASTAVVTADGTAAVTEEMTDAMTRSVGSDSGHSAASQASCPDDFVMVELKTPFAGRDTNSDLGQFYRDCQVAPPLCMFADDAGEVGGGGAAAAACVQHTLSDVCAQLAAFDVNARAFDEFVNSLRGPEEETVG